MYSSGPGFLHSKYFWDSSRLLHIPVINSLLLSPHYMNILSLINSTVERYLSCSQVLAGEGNGTPLQYSCLENPMDGGAWWAAVHGIAEGWTRLSDLTFTFHFDVLEKEVATHSSVLAWRIPGTGEPCGLPSMGSHRVKHDWSDLAAAAAVHSLSKTANFCPASFCIPKPNLPVTPGILWLPNFTFQSPMMKRTFFFFFWCLF